MREYKKPTVKVVNLKSSDDIAVISYEDIASGMIQDYLMKVDRDKTYAVTQYTLTSSKQVINQ